MSSPRITAILVFAILISPGCLSLADIDPEIIEGCTDELAINYDENANSNDGSCEYQIVETLKGCTSPSAINYNPDAEENDYSCIFTASPLEIDTALEEITNSLFEFQNKELMDSSLVLTSNNGPDETLMTLTNDDDGIKLVSSGAIAPFTIIDNSGIVTLCETDSDDCSQFRNYGSDSDNINSALQIIDQSIEYDEVLRQYQSLLSLRIPAGNEWSVNIENVESTYQTATAFLGPYSLTAILSIGSISLKHLEITDSSQYANGITYELSVEGVQYNTPEAQNPSLMPAEISFSEPIITDDGPIFIWECYLEYVDLDSLENDEVETVQDAQYSEAEFPDFCGENINNDPEESEYSSLNPIFDTRWGSATYIWDEESGDIIEVVMEIEYSSDSIRWNYLDLTSDQCEDQNGNYDQSTQRCEIYSEEANVLVSDQYFCQDDDEGDNCHRYGINSDGHLFFASEREFVEPGPPPVMEWECYMGLVDLDALENDDVDTVRDAMWYYSDMPDFCGELVEDDPENGSFTSTGPIFDTRWGTISYIMSGDTYKEVVFEQDIAATSTTTYILDVTADECSENGGTYNILTQICDLGAYEGDNTASDLYICMDDYCDRYGINEDGHLFTGYEVEDDGEEPEEGDLFWICDDSFFAEDTTPLGPDSDESVQAQVDAMSEPEWCGDAVELDGSFESDSSSETDISSSNWNNPDGFYLDFLNSGSLNQGIREMSQDECSEYGGTWNSIEDACEMPVGEWSANETLVELSFWGDSELIRYEIIDGGIVLAFSEEESTGAPDMENTFQDGYEDVGYDSYEFIATEDGLHIFESEQDNDGYLYLYEGFFDSGEPVTNAIAAQDDWGDGSVIHWDLTSGQNYVIVTTMYSEEDGEMSFDNTIISPSDQETTWSGEINSDSPTFIRPDGYWEENPVEENSGSSMLVQVDDSHWNNVPLDELNLEIFVDGMFAESMLMSSNTETFDGITISIYDKDGNGLLSNGDEFVIQTESISFDSLTFEIWDEWAQSYATLI